MGDALQPEAGPRVESMLALWLMLLACLWLPRRVGSTRRLSEDRHVETTLRSCEAAASFYRAHALEPPAVDAMPLFNPL